MPAISDFTDLIAFEEIAVVSERAWAASARLRTSACSRSLSSFLTRKSFSRWSMYSPRSMASASAARGRGDLFLFGHLSSPCPCRRSQPAICAEQRLVVQELGDALLGVDPPVHEAEQLLELAAHAGAARPSCGICSAILSGAKSPIDLKLRSSASSSSRSCALGLRQRVLHPRLHPRAQRLHELREAPGVDVDELAVADRLRRLGGLRGAGEVRHHPHHERQLDGRRAAVVLHVVGDLHPRRAVALDHLGLAFSHVRVTLNCGMLSCRRQGRRAGGTP